MEIRNLITFVQVAELNSFTKAAKALDYSQSTVSFQIKQLEHELGGLLFERINHTITLTEKGRELLAYAKQVRYLTEEFNQRHDSDHELSGTVRIAVPDSVCEDMMLHHYMDFHALYPGLRLVFTTADTAMMFHMLDHNEVDLVLALDTPIYHKDYQIVVEDPIGMHFVTRADSPYALKGSVSLKELSSFPFLLTEHGVGYRRVLDEAAARLSLNIRPILEIGRTDILMGMLENGVGVSFLPDFVTEKKVKDGTLCYLNVTDVSSDIRKQLLYHRDKWATSGLRAVIEFIRSHEFGR